MARSSFPSDDIDKLLVRFPEGMRDRIKESADLLGRSMNAEIIQRLKRSLEESRDDRVKLDLPGDVWNALMADAAIHGLQMDERAVEILTNAYHESADYTLALEKLRDMSGQISDLSELVAHLKEKEDADFLLYFGKVIQIRQFAAAVLQIGDLLPANLREIAEGVSTLSKAEFETLKARHEDAMFKKSLVEKARRTSQEIAENESDEAEE
ncbi:Arc family DNA-binding protein [Rhizobium rhizogenes]|uniref:Arc family DNA-binding protein n=1 Tax=Rhizobium rhizogenes TaxID=359 RepID=UPI000692177F|nr:Arc family DNA-binding protein [Rhizobium rhizogenes]NTI79168.1 Arc family DNA-binding protein [Rhizobium rhizogenes]NTJ21269.1 Arc family DNA-binding protein [Rhizobium rhizogenes]QUE80032.1 Arc family DNA-binding protein [Rhizobium rhizogenes]TQO78139.1 Arc family DNA-binding protein [Rhizobium rhizogenes]TRB51128.1 Arc family DNA-binding protein [Rhizobium rhizogenes]